MTDTSDAPEHGGARRSQARGRQRRARLLVAASTLLGERELDEISLQDLAKEAGIPTGSAYHFYANASDAFAALTEEIGDDLSAALREPISPDRLTVWEDVIEVAAERAVRFYAARADARQLLIGPKTQAQYKRSDRENDRRLGSILRDHIAEVFVLPEIPYEDDVYFHAVEIIDLFYSLSTMRNGGITPEMAAEAVRAAVAYLRTYLPAALPRATSQREVADG
ncbi:TetR/AcrR family transcriptional regulator [Gordonia sp. SL306]|uniref:TetR/AcrR family transcriptional regulator n=1 Tax=Gordonia sp. SL306 TaxID=2995145 RepID=UPI002271A7D1|nr:TetR/AcrR family transcriptional regulator [Gordonia sp. SL306]WAC57732.1 TetR/AcrR family transcriptional regulator [Gordonia sp. SL306]